MDQRQIYLLKLALFDRREHIEFIVSRRAPAPATGDPVMDQLHALGRAALAQHPNVGAIRVVSDPTGIIEFFEEAQK